jgi:hypothetical protein
MELENPGGQLSPAGVCSEAHHCSAARQYHQEGRLGNSCTLPTISFQQEDGRLQGSICQLLLNLLTMAAYMFSRPSNPSKAHRLLTSRQGRNETTTRHGKLVLAIGTINLCSFFGSGASSPFDCSGTPGSFVVPLLGDIPPF